MKEKKPIIVCRPLFYTVLKYIYLGILGLGLLGSSISTLYFANTFMGAILSLIVVLISYFVSYLLFNWLYKCVLKTMLALTKKELHFEFYRPFVKLESTIPLESIKKVTTMEYFWIFRVIIIHQYHHIPLVFATWNNKEMKAEINKLIIDEEEKVLNEGDNGGLISKDHYKKCIKIIGIVLGALLLITGIRMLITRIQNNKYIGEFSNNNINLTINSDGYCQYDDSLECTWDGYRENGDYYVKVEYEYEYEYKYYYRTYTSTKTDSFTAKLNTKDKTYEKVSD